jgi:hypothetical protein
VKGIHACCNVGIVYVSEVGNATGMGNVEVNHEYLDAADMPAAEYDLGDVYMCNFACESAYNLVCNLLPKVSRKLIFDLFLLKCVVHEIVRVFVHV